MPTNTGPTGQRASAIWSDFGGKIKFKKGVISNPPHHGFVGRVSTRPTTTARGTGAVGMNPDLQHTATSRVGRVSTRPATTAHGTGAVGMNPDLQHTATSRVGRVSTRPATTAHGTGAVGMNPDLQNAKKGPDLPGPFLSCL